MDVKLRDYLEKHSINYTEYPHKAVFRVSESKTLKKDIPGLHCKCLFLKDNCDRFYLVAVPADKRLDISRLRKRLNLKKLHFASEFELLEKIGLKPGSVSIFGIINDKENQINFILDGDVWSANAVGFHPNLNTSTLVLLHDDLERFYNSVKTNKRVMQL